MPSAGLIKAVLKEYGPGWVINRTLYSVKLRSMSLAPFTEKWYEKKPSYPKRLDIFDIDVQSLKAFLSGLSESDKEKLVSAADQACDGIICGFSSVELDYGNPMDWQLSPLTGKRCDERKKWYKIPDFDRERGDIKVIWEASRFSHFVTLARAYLLTSDHKYYRAFSRQLKDWLEKNPYGCGANFKCSQECSLRMVNALLAYAVFRKGGAASDADVSCLKDLVDRCYRKILSNFFYAYRCIRNNHTISELMGMIVGAWCCDDRMRLEKGYRLLDEVIAEQFTEDGGYRQFSFNYQRLALQDLEVILSIGAVTGKTLSEKSRDRIRNAAWLLYQCQDESGDVPNYGNNDGALVFPVTSCGYRDFQPVINTIYALCEGKQLYGSGPHQEELLWFSGGKKADAYAAEDRKRVSSRFPKAGLFTLRGPKAWAMTVSNRYTSRPAHMDQLHLDLWADGINILCDAGTYSYASDDGRRMVRNESHNTAVVDGAAQMNSSGPFMIYNWTRRESADFDDGYWRSKIVSANGYSHTREVRRIGSSFEITDCCDRDYSVVFHTICEVEKGGRGYIFKHDGKILCTFECGGEVELGRSERSLYYLKKDVTACLIVKGHGGAEIKTKITIAEGE